MYAIALRSLPPADPPQVQALAGALGTTAYEARARLMVPGGGPAVVARVPDGAAASALATRLRAAGFVPLVVDTATMSTAATRFATRRLGWDARMLLVTDRAGHERQVAWGDIRLIVRATGIHTGEVTETQTQRKFSAGRAMLTGGLMLTKKQTTSTTHATEDWQAFMVVYPSAGSPIEIQELETLYEGPDAPPQPTRQATFMHILQHLRTACPQAAYHDALMRRAGQLQLLGPTLAPEQYLDVALALVEAAHRT